MRATMLVLLVTSAVAATAAAVVLSPADAAACSPCLPNGTGEKWVLEVESWTIDGSP